MLQDVAKKKKENIWGLGLSDWGQIPALPPLMLCDLRSLSRSINPGGGHRSPRCCQGARFGVCTSGNQGPLPTPSRLHSPGMGGTGAGLLRLSAADIRGLVGAAQCRAAPPASTHHGPLSWLYGPTILAGRVFLTKTEKGFVENNSVYTIDDSCLQFLRAIACMFCHVQLFCDPMDCSRPGSSLHGILHAKLLEWVVMPSSRGSS